MHNKTKYKSDLKQHIRESKLEDFITTKMGASASNTGRQIRESKLEDFETGPGSAVLVSTIHQTKGREFDNIFLAYSGFPKMDDATRRAIYVAITRAKQNLSIFCNTDHFDKITAENITRTTDDTDYPTPLLISLQLSHKDVALGFFAVRRREIDALRSGQELTINETGCISGDTHVLKFSARFLAQVAELAEKGYTPVKATVRHIVFWQGKDMEKEIKIILPNVEFSKDLNT
jgi:ATP-dependent DNA helicase RecQ